MNPKYHLLIAAAALSLGACTKDDTRTETGIENGGYKISFTVAEDSETRTTLDKDGEGRDILQWDLNDEVGIYTVGQNVNSNISTTADVGKSPVEFVGNLGNSVSSGDKFYAYYPYNAAQSADPARATLTIPAEQTQTEAGVYNGQTHPLVAVPVDFKWEQDHDAYRINNVKFRLLGAIVELQLFSSDKAFRGEQIRWVAFESETPLAGDFTFDLTSVTATKEPQIEEYEWRVARTKLMESADIPATKNEAALVYLTIAPGTYKGQVVVETDVAQYTFPLAEPMTFKRAVIKGLLTDLAGADRDIINSNAPIPFKDDEVKRICLENWDKNSDGELSYHEAAIVESIGTIFRGASISSFDELQYFTRLQSIEKFAFYDCRNLRSITIPDGVTSIGSYAFWCNDLTSIIIPDGVTTIGQAAFYCCSNLKSINIPQTVSSIGQQIFAGCTSLSAFYGKYASANHRYLILDTTLFAFAPAGLTEYTIPDEVTVIGASTFERCSSLKSIHIPDGVTEIGPNAFDSCIYLTNINIPDRVTKIEVRTFAGCRSLTSIRIPDGVTDIGTCAFNSCNNLKSVYCEPTTPPSIGTDALTYTSSAMKIYVPTASVEKYKTAEGWIDYANQIVEDNSSTQK